MRKRKSLCSWFDVIDSFDMFKFKEGIEWVRNSADRTCFQIPRYNLQAKLMDDYSLSISFDAGSYIIPVEKKPCNFGGFYYFFHCPSCQARMRKLYCIQGAYVCRKCAHLGYYSQRLTPFKRCEYMSEKIEKKLKNHAGSLDRKPPWKKWHTFQKLRKKYIEYDEKRFHALRAEPRASLDLFDPMRHRMASKHYWSFMPHGFSDVYDFKNEIDC